MLDPKKRIEEPEVIERIGPEGKPAEEVMDEMEAYGWEVMDEGDFESDVTAESDQPDWMNEEARERSNVASAINEDGDGTTAS